MNVRKKMRSRGSHFVERPLPLVEQNVVLCVSIFFQHDSISNIYIAKFTFWEYYII